MITKEEIIIGTKDELIKYFYDIGLPYVEACKSNIKLKTCNNQGTFNSIEWFLKQIDKIISENNNIGQIYYMDTVHTIKHSGEIPQLSIVLKWDYVRIKESRIKESI